MNKKDLDVVFSKNSDEWETPDNIFNFINQRYGWISLDACATKENTKCRIYFTPEVDGLKQSWSPSRGVFVNPPYSQVNKWVEKAYKESIENNLFVVMLIPARTDTRWFHKYCTKAKEIAFFKGRIKFKGNSNNSAPFPSMVVIFDGKTNNNPEIKFIDLPPEKRR